MVLNNALHAAASEWRSRKVRALVKAGLAVNARRDADNNTPLYLAACKGHKEVVRVLLEAGADTDQASTTDHGESYKNRGHRATQPSPTAEICP